MNIQSAINEASLKLKKNNIASPLIDSEILMTKVLDKKIMDLNFPLTAIIGGVIRYNEGIIALGGFKIQLGDRVLVCSKPESIKKVESLFL